MHLDFGQLVAQLPVLRKEGINQVSLYDPQVASSKKNVLLLCQEIQNHYPDLFLILQVRPEILDQNVVQALEKINVSLEIPLEGCVKNGTLLFDKKFYSGRANLLNQHSLVFGFEMSFALQEGDTFKAFRDRLNFAMTLYPNHMSFPQFQDEPFPKSTAVFSSKDIEFAREIAFACRTFYTAGRAVPWFNTVVKALKIESCAFYSDFSEFQQVNSASFDGGFVPEEIEYREIEKLVLNFLGHKFEEKHKMPLLIAATDMVRLNGAFSMVAQEGVESDLELSYNPDDLLSPFALDLARFVEEVTMEKCQVHVFEGDGYPDYRTV